MPRLSTDAARVLERMQGHRGYDLDDLRALAPEISVEHLRDIMHELWVSRRVERVGYSGWRRHASSQVADADAGPTQPKLVRPEELFDHEAFAEFFK
jgi:hypothetical protein